MNHRMEIHGFNGSVFLDVEDIKVATHGVKEITLFTQSMVNIKITPISDESLHIMQTAPVASITTRDRTIFVSMESLEFEKFVGFLQRNGVLFL